MERSYEPMDKNWIEGAAEQGERARNREARGSEKSTLPNPLAVISGNGREYHDPSDLNSANRPVRTRMPGGVGGARPALLVAPIPIRLKLCELLSPRAALGYPNLKIASVSGNCFGGARNNIA